MELTIKQESFEGPLDLLLHLIEKNKMSIYDIEISLITQQYMEYLEKMEQDKSVSLDSMSEFIVMAATLVYIKSKMLLPKPVIDEVEEDPREELVIRLLEYKKMKHIAKQLEERKQDKQKTFFRNNPVQEDMYQEGELDISEVLGDLSIEHICNVFNDIMMRNKSNLEETKEKLEEVILNRDRYTITDKSRYIMDMIKINKEINFYDLFNSYNSKTEIVVTFMALLELVQKGKIKVYQKNVWDDIWIGGVNYNE